MKAIFCKATAAAAAVAVLSGAPPVLAQTIPPAHDRPVLALLNDIPPFPTSAKQASSLARITRSGVGLRVDVRESITGLGNKVKGYAEATNARGSLLATSPGPSAPSQAQMDIARQMQDPAFQKKLAAMSQQEKMAWAMQMERAMAAQAMTGARPPVPEDPAVIRAMERLERHVHELLMTGAYGRSGTPVWPEIEKALEAINKEMDEVSNRLSEEFERLPLSRLVTGGKDPAGVRRIMLTGATKRIEIIDKHLKPVLPHWEREMARARQHIGAIDQILGGIGYYDKARNDSTRAGLMGYQANALEYVASLCRHLERVVDAVAGAPEWKELIESLPQAEFEGRTSATR